MKAVVVPRLTAVLCRTSWKYVVVLLVFLLVALKVLLLVWLRE